MRRINFLVFLMLAVCLFAVSAFATTYYVNGETGSNDNDGLTPETAFATVQYADNAELLQPGDTVIVAAGIYTGPAQEEDTTNARFGVMLKSCNGTAEAPITYKGEPGAIITQRNTVAEVGNKNNWCLNIGVTNIVIDGFEFYGAFGLVNVWGGRYAEVKNCVIHDTTPRNTTPRSAGVYFDSAAYGVVHDCVFHDIKGGGGVAAAIDNQGAYSSNAGAVPASVYYRNVFYNIEGAALMIRGGATNDRFYHNTIVGATRGVYTMAGASGKPAGTATVVNNIFSDVTGATFYAANANATITNSNNLVYNSAGCTNCTFGASTVNGNPKFGDPDNNDYTLTEGSYAVDLGMDLGEAYLGNAPDAGAFESPFEGNFIGSIEGTVTRAASEYYPAAPVRGATVTVGETTTTTDAEGKYNFALPFGDYEIVVNDGAATANVSLYGETVTKNFVLNATVGDTWYVSAEGDDFEGDGSEANPFASIDQPDLLEIMKPGDTVIVKEGTYTDQESLLGFELRTQGASALAPMVYKAEGNVTVDMTDYMNQAAANMVSGIYVGYTGAYSISGVVIDGFNFSNCQIGICLRDNGKDFVVSNCTFEDMYLPAEYGTGAMSRRVGGICFSKSSDSYCHHNIFKNIGDSRAQTASALCMPGAGNVAVYNNTFDNTTTISTDWAGAGIATNPFVNNIVMNMSDVALWCESNGLITASYNLFDNCPVGTVGSGIIDDGNNFIASAGLDADYVPQNGSFAVDAGIDVGFAFEGSAPDLGAKESQATAAGDYFTITAGNVKSSKGNPLSGVTVTVAGQTFTTDVNGDFVTAPFKTAEQNVTVDAALANYVDYSDSVVLTEGDNTINIVMTKDPNFHGTTYYVDGENGSNENDGLTPETAFATIQYADNAELLQPGDTVIVAPGVYTGPTQAEDTANARFGIMLKSCNGTVEDPITYKGMPGAKMTQMNTIAEVGNKNNWGLNIGVTNVVIDGFEIYGAYGLVNVWGGRYAEVKNCVLHDTTPRATTPSSAGVYFDSGAYGLVHDCTFYNISGRVGTSLYVAAGIDNQGAYSYNAGEVPASEYHHNLFYDVDGAALMVRGGATNDLFYNNTVSNALYAVYNNSGSKVAGSSTAVNNIIYGMRTYTFRNVNGGVMTNHDNLVYPLKSFNGCEMGENTLIADPFFADVTNKDFSLTYGSPAIDAGVDLGYEYLGSAPDFGAFEFDPSSVTFTDVDDPAELNDIEDGTAVNFTFPALAYTSQGDFADNSVYVGNADRLGGGKFILPAGSDVVAGDVLTVKGVVMSDADGKYIKVTEITSKTAGEAVKALGMTWGVLDNDVLVRVWGKVVSVADGTFVINNGTGDVTVKGTTTKEVGDFVTVTGVANKTGVRAIEVL